MCLNTQVMRNWIRGEEKYSLKTERWRKQRLLFLSVRGNCQCHIPFPLGNESRRPCRLTQVVEWCRERTTRSSETKTWNGSKYSKSESAVCYLPLKQQKEWIPHCPHDLEITYSNLQISARSDRNPSWLASNFGFHLKVNRQFHSILFF